jgi:Flp pilus assembly protein TadD
MRGTARLPDGEERDLITIQRWNFDWQDQYRYVKPVALPAGTELRLDYTYDNSADNPFNPRSPPVPVRYGPESTDEMAELILEVRPRDAAALAVLDRHFEEKWLGGEIAWLGEVLAATPDDALARATLGAYLQRAGRSEEAAAELGRAAETDPDMPGIWAAHAAALFKLDKVDEAIAAYERARTQDPGDVVVHNNLGNALMKKGRLGDAEASFRRALALEPAHASAHNNLGVLARRRGDPAQAVEHFEDAIEGDAQEATYVRNLGAAQAALGHYTRAVSTYERALALAGGDMLAAEHLAWLLATCPEASVRDPRRAVAIAQQAVRMTQGRSPSLLDALAAAFAAAGDFESARGAGTRALELARAANATELEGTIAQHLAAFEAGEPWVGAPR